MILQENDRKDKLLANKSEKDGRMFVDRILYLEDY